MVTKAQNKALLKEIIDFNLNGYNRDLCNPPYHARTNSKTTYNHRQYAKLYTQSCLLKNNQFMWKMEKYYECSC